MKKFNLTSAALVAVAAAWWACSSSGDPAPLAYPAVATAASPNVLATTAAGVTVYNGGFGSALAADPADPSVFYLLTDRGPNADGTGDNKVFPVPTFTPQIGKFKLDGDSLRLLQTILLKDATGKPLTGLPNPAGQGGTGETALDLSGKPLGTDPNGLDSEGLVALADGTFWVSDEYGPYLVHFDATGKTLERISPFSTGKALPRVLARRRPNRGMEGLTVTPDGKTLVGMMQSPLYNPNKAAVAASRTLRLVTFDLATGATKQFLYLIDNVSYTGVSEIAALTNDTFLVLERDGNYLQNGTAPAKLLYKISLADATDVSDPANAEGGRLVNGKTLDSATPDELTANGIKPVQKMLAVDILKAVPTYPHDKPEGLAVLSPTLVAVSNDDDFGITTGPTPGTVVRKILPSTGKVDRNTVYFIKLDAALK
jgi:hypothetical protein